MQKKALCLTDGLSKGPADLASLGAAARLILPTQTYSLKKFWTNSTLHVIDQPVPTLETALRVGDSWRLNVYKSIPAGAHGGTVAG